MENKHLCEKNMLIDKMCINRGWAVPSSVQLGEYLTVEWLGGRSEIENTAYSSKLELEGLNLAKIEW